MDLRYVSVDPEVDKATYEAGESVDFVLSGLNRSIIKNSLRLEGELFVSENGVIRATGNHIQYNHRVGAHGLIENISVETNQGIIENINFDYPRYVAMVGSATKSVNDYNDSASLPELRVANRKLANVMCKGHSDLTSNAQLFKDMDFSFKPLICFNRASGGDIDFNKTGLIRISLNLSSNTTFLNGGGNVATSKYTLRNLRLTYQSIPTPQGGSSPMVMRSIVPLKKVLQSNFNNISSKVSAVCDGVSISFLRSNKENVLAQDQQQLDKLSATRVQFLINDSSQYITYAITDYGDMCEKYIQSLGFAGHSQVNTETLKGNHGFGLGVSFGAMIDLSTSEKFNVQIQDSNITNLNNVNMYMFFHTQFQM